MAPLIKNSFYLLDACLLFIPTTAYINSPSVNVCVCEAVCVELEILADKWRLALRFLRSPLSG